DLLTFSRMGSREMNYQHCDTQALVRAAMDAVSPHYAGAGVGAYTGSLVGGLKEIEDEPSPDHSDVRQAANMVAVNVDASGVSEDAIVRTFEESGALVVESAEGRWSEGSWADFDPTSRPNVIGGLEFARRADTRSPENRPSV
ncbi:MAG: hypothetical protein H7Y14_04455, partial [Burkholderiales bacterium]|nr:hypothetical protein [Burkholderiales bacterium]